MLAFIRKHPIGVGTGTALALVGLAWLAFGFFGVHTLFIDDVVDESGPVFDAGPAVVATDAPLAETSTSEPEAAAQTEGEGDTAPTPPSPTVVVGSEEPAEPAAQEVITEYRGAFESGAHPTSGTAAVLGNGTGQRFLRLEDFETDNGPDLNVYLVNSSTGDVSDYVDLGDLKGNIGDQNYEISVDIDLDLYDEVNIWCVRFGVSFGDALLTPA